MRPRDSASSTASVVVALAEQLARALQLGGAPRLGAIAVAGGDEAPMRSAEIGASDDVMGAILANASLAAMDIADGSNAPSVAPLLEKLELPTQRAAQLYGRIRLFGSSVT